MIDLIKIAKDSAAEAAAKEAAEEKAKENAEYERVIDLCKKHFNETIIDDISYAIQQVVEDNPKWFVTDGVKIEVRVNNYSDTTTFRVNRTDTMILQAGSNQVNVHLDVDKDEWLTLSSNSKKVICRYVGERLAKVFGFPWEEDYGRIYVRP